MAFLVVSKLSGLMVTSYKMGIITVTKLFIFVGPAEVMLCSAYTVFDTL